MSDDFIHILSTGPIPGLDCSSRVVLDIIPFISIELNPYEAVSQHILEYAGEISSVVFTSANAVEAVGLILNGKQPLWKIYCIAHSTKEKLSEYFINPDIVGLAASSAALAELIARDHPGSVLFFCGNLRRDEIPLKMKEKNIALNELVVYKTVYTPVKLHKNYSGILFFSPGAVESFFSVNNVDPRVIMFAIGNTTGSEITKHCNNEILTADKPDKLELAQKAINYFEEKTNHDDIKK